MMKKLFSTYSILVAVGVFIIVVIVSMWLKGSLSQKEENSVASSLSAVSQNTDVSDTPVTPTAADSEMKAVWVPYMSLDMSREADQSEAGFQKKFDEIVAGAKEKGMNALIVQVRPFGDALYDSELFPWSSILSGTQGVDPGYDPLEYMVSASHKAGLEIHAWVNPLRIQIKNSPSILSQDNPYNLWKDDPNKAGWTVDWGETSGKYYNPAYEEVRRYITDGVLEIVKNYDVDGIQFDDYFYPTTSPEFDKDSYNAYCASAQKNGTPLSLLEWRKSNINALVSLIYQEIKAAKPHVVFGISPQGNVQNDENMGADVKTWCSTSGYLDYICPQLYVNFENAYLPFDEAAQTWRDMVTNSQVKLYYGIGLYKAGSDVDNGTWKNANDILARQVSLGRQLQGDGFIFYSYDYLNNPHTKQEVENVMKVL